MDVLYLAGTIFLSFFILYSIARHDFVLLRQNISLRLVFDRAFIALIVSFLLGRLLFALNTNQFSLVNILRFLYLTKYWGVSEYIMLVALIGMVFILFRKRKNILRIFDIYALSFFPLITLEILYKNLHNILLLIKLLGLLVAVILFFVLLKLHKNYSVKDGFLSAVVIMFSSLTTLLLSALSEGFLRYPFAIIQGISFVVLVASVLFIIAIQKNIFAKP